jgi:hypothetical protein
MPPMPSKKFAKNLPVPLLLVLLVLGGCSRPEDAQDTAAETVRRGAEVKYSYAQTNDLRVAPQLGPGWYPVEDGGWRWMAHEAQLTLRAPETVPAQFEVRLALPKGHIALIGPVEFSVLFNDQPFAKETYTKDGQHTLTKDVPAGALTHGPIRVTLRVSKTRVPGTGGDLRELGAVIAGVGFK